MPLMLSIAVRSVFWGKEKAILAVGPGLTRAAKRALRYWVPEILDASQFDDFKKRMKRNVALWRILYDVDIAEDSQHTFKVHVRNCPFCEVFTFVGLNGINKYICKADWEIAEDNRGKWSFTRQNTIAAGDHFCDHTYKRERCNDKTPKSKDRMDAAARDIELRLIRTEDIAAIKKWPPYSCGFEQMDYALRDNGWLDEFRNRTNTWIFAAELKKRVIGFSLLSVTANKNAEFRIALHPDWTGKGLGIDVTLATLRVMTPWRRTIATLKKDWR